MYLHMLEIPLHLRFKWTRMNGLEDYIAPFVYGGPDFSIVSNGMRHYCCRFDGGCYRFLPDIPAYADLESWQISNQ